MFFIPFKVLFLLLFPTCLILMQSIFVSIGPKTQLSRFKCYFVIHKHDIYVRFMLIFQETIVPFKLLSNLSQHFDRPSRTTANPTRKPRSPPRKKRLVFLLL